MSQDSNDFLKLQDLLRTGRFVTASHLGAQDRPIAPVGDPRDFSWCALYQPGECGGHWNWDKRMMFSGANLGGPAFDGKTFHIFLCFNHFLQSEFGLSPMQDKLGHTCYVPPHVEYRGIVSWRIIQRLFPIQTARRVARLFDRGVRIRTRGWKHAPLARARASLVFRIEGAWDLFFHGFIHIPREPTPCEVCGRIEDHAHEGWVKGYRVRRK